MSIALYSVLIKPGFGWRFRQLAGISSTIGNEDSGRIAGISSLSIQVNQYWTKPSSSSKNSPTGGIENFSNNILLVRGIELVQWKKFDLIRRNKMILNYQEDNYYYWKAITAEVENYIIQEEIWINKNLL